MDSSNWHDDTAWHRDANGKLMCATCNTEVFGGICDCMPDDDEETSTEEAA